MNEQSQKKQVESQLLSTLACNSKVDLFFHHPVYKQAGQAARNTLTTIFKQKKFTVKFDVGLFQIKHGKVRFCRKSIVNKYFQCKDCQLNDSCLCQQCFDFEKHKTHNFTVRNSSEGYCDCGINHRWKQQGFCDFHGPQIDIQVEIDGESRKKFMDFFSDCFAIYFELVFQSISTQADQKESLKEIADGAKTYISAMMNELNRLNTKSSYYKKLTSELLMREVQVNSRNGQTIKAPILAQLMTRQHNYLPKSFSDLIICLSDNDKVLKLFYKTYYQSFSQQQITNNRNLSDLIYETDDYLHIYNQLADDRVLAFYRPQKVQSAKNMVSYYIQILKKNRNNFCQKQAGKLLNCWKQIQRTGLINTDIISEDKFLLILEDSTPDANLCQQILSIYIQSLIKKIDKLDQTENKRMKRSQKISRQLNKIFKIIFQICWPNPQRVALTFLDLCQNSCNVQKIFQQYLQEIFNKSTRISKIALKAVAQTIKIVQKKNQIDIMQKIIDNMVNLNSISLQKFFPNLLNASVFERAKKAWIQYRFAKQPKQKEYFSLQSQAQFKKFLCMHKKVPLSVISKLRKMKLLDFYGAGNILEECTTFDDTQKQFIYKNELQSYSDCFVLSFDDLISRSYAIPLVFNPQTADQRFRQAESDENRIDNQTVLGELLIPIFQYFEKKGENIFTSIKNDEESHKFVKACIVIDKIMDGKIQYLRTQLKQIQKAVYMGQLPVLMSEFATKIQSKEQKLQILSQYQQEEKCEMKTESKSMILKKEQQKEINIQGQNKQPVEEKKKKLKAKTEKFKQKAEKISKKYLTESPSKESPSKFQKIQEQQKESICCLYCKEPKSLNNRMFYFAQTKTQNLLNNFFKKTLVCDQIFETCLHPIHEQCFTEYIGNNTQKNCLLCNLSRNCILPLSNDSQSRDQEQQEGCGEIWRNRIVYVSIKEYRNYNVQETVLMLLKGLVARNGIMEILQPQTKDFQFKTNSHLFKVMKDSYAYMNQKKRKRVQKKFAKMLQLTHKNANIGIGLIEELLLKAYWGEVSYVIDNKQDTDEIRVLLHKLQGFLNPNQFALIRKQIEFIKKQKYDLDQGQDNVSQLLNIPSIFDLKPPKSAQQMLKLRCHCKKCKSVRGWYCLLCKITYCYECDMINLHKSQIHQGNCIIIPLTSGSFQIISKQRGSVEFIIYRNQFMEEWDSNSKNPGEFKLNEGKYGQAINKWLKVF